MYIFVCFAAVLITSCYGQSQMVVSSGSCGQRNQYIPVPDSCDSYIVCRNYTAINAECPDGLHFNPSAVWPNYPCSYPSDAPCKGRGSPQSAEPTTDCPHQYGYFPSSLETAPDCGRYRLCVAGKAIEMYCPPGLAFDSAHSRCDWAENVPGCNVADYLGFKCPPTQVDSEGYPIETNHPYSGDCTAFFACINGNPRLLTCDGGLAFDPNSSRCVDASLVNCSQINTVPYNSKS